MGDGVPLARVGLVRSRARRVLVIDGDRVACHMLADAFAGRGFEAIFEDDGERGLRRIAAELLDLDLVVTGLELPRLDGEDLVYRVRQLGGEHDLPIVVASNGLTEVQRERLGHLGADAVVDKALGPERIAALAVAAHAGREAELGRS